MPYCPFALLPFRLFRPLALNHNPYPNPNPNPSGARKGSTRFHISIPPRGAAYKVRFSFALEPLSPFALLPYCPIALMPYCPFALLPFCPFAHVPYSPIALMPY